MNTPPLNAGSGQGEAGEVSAREQVLTSLSLVYYPNPILRALCQPVELFDSTLNDLVQEMFALMTLREGIGLAGPQVSIDQRVLVCAIQGRQLCLTNPEIIEADTPAEAIEGCLSLPNIQVTVRRPERIQVSGYDTDGRSGERVRHGWSQSPFGCHRPVGPGHPTRTGPSEWRPDLRSHSPVGRILRAMPARVARGPG